VSVSDSIMLSGRPFDVAILIDTNLYEISRERTGAECGISKRGYRSSLDEEAS
jgi:hypothetical protein